MPIPAEVYNELHLEPSILSADFLCLGAEVDRVMEAGVRLIHVDIMDGHFVPNLTIGPVVLASLAKQVHARGGLFSVHLMISEPSNFIKAFVDAGADALSFHVEAEPHLHQTLRDIKSLGAAAGVAINPGTSVSAVSELLEWADFFLVMTVNPGFAGQEMISAAVDKARQLRKLVPANTAIEIDGGVKAGNIQQVVKAGANWIVAGSAVFGAADPGAEARKLQGLMKTGS